MFPAFSWNKFWFWNQTTSWEVDHQVHHQQQSRPGGSVHCKSIKLCIVLCKSLEIPLLYVLVMLGMCSNLVTHRQTVYKTKTEFVQL